MFCLQKMIRLLAVLPLFFQLAPTFATEATSSALFPDEDLIPFYAHLVEDFESDFGRLQKGDRVVVIRPVDEANLRVNLSRAGTINIPAGITDVDSEIERIKRGDDDNLRIVPRMSFFLASRVVSGESGWQNPVPRDAINSSDRWFLLYGDAKEEATREAIRAASGFYERLSQRERERTVFVYMDTPGDKKAIHDVAESLNPSIQCMPGYLSRGYAESLDHIDREAELPQLVEVASSGRIKQRIAGETLVTEWLQKGTR